MRSRSPEEESRRGAVVGSSRAAVTGDFCPRRWASLSTSGSAPANPIERARRVGEKCFPSTETASCVSGTCSKNPANKSILQRAHGMAAADHAAARTSGLVAAASGRRTRKAAIRLAAGFSGCTESSNTADEISETTMPATPLAMQTGTVFHSASAWGDGVSELTNQNLSKMRAIFKGLLALRRVFATKYACFTWC
jgi:hypothetical protein